MATSSAATATSQARLFSQAGAWRLPDKEYLDAYLTYRRKPWHPDRGFEIRAYIPLQRLIIRRYEQEVESKNTIIFSGRSTGQDWDLNTLEDVRQVIHKHCEAVDDLEKMLGRRPARMSDKRRNDPHEKEYWKDVGQQGAELRLLDPGFPSPATQVMRTVGSLVIDPLLTSFGITTLLVPMLLILFIPNLSKGAVVGIVLGALILLSITLHYYSILVQWFEATGWPMFEPRSAMTGKEIFGNLAAYAAVLFVFVGAYLAPSSQ